MNRRSFISSVLALSAAPAIVRASSIMRVKPLILPLGYDSEFSEGVIWQINPREHLLFPLSGGHIRGAYHEWDVDTLIPVVRY